ncbi:MAG: hypothetical protein K2P95_03575 [Hyphomonadaceae bacterium]|nr:hypothetical protein [Hyphomonadaceae bacterium]
MRLDVLPQCSFAPDARSRMEGASLILFLEEQGKLRQVRKRAIDLSSFHVCDGVWEEYLQRAGCWTRAISSAATVGAPAAAANQMLAEFFPGQRAILTWANAVLGATAAAAAMQSQRPVRFKARFNDGLKLEARAPEAALTARLSTLLHHAVKAQAG